MKTPQFTIGTKFIPHTYTAKLRRDKVASTITDILTTTNANGEVVKIEYECTCEYLGQTLKAHYPQSTIARSEIVYTPIELPVPTGKSYSELLGEAMSEMDSNLQKLANYVGNEIAYKIQEQMT